MPKRVQAILKAKEGHTMYWYLSSVKVKLNTDLTE
jgi:hypothetical protein